MKAGADMGTFGGQQIFTKKKKLQIHPPVLDCAVPFCKTNSPYNHEASSYKKKRVFTKHKSPNT